MGHVSIRRMRRIQTSDLFLPLHNELVTLLRGLDEPDWSRPTVAKQWVVKDVVAHLLDTDMRRLSSMRDGYRPASRSGNINSYDEIVTLINHLNATWVEVAERLSPRVLIELLEWSGPQVASLFASLPPDDDSFLAVAWAGEERSANWMDVGREYTEKWHHQEQIRDAVGMPGLTGRRWLAPVLELAMYALPHSFRHAEVLPGSTLSFTIEGEAGGVWHITNGSSGWELREEEPTEATACVRLDTETAWRLFFNALRQGKQSAGLRLTCGKSFCTAKSARN